MPIHGLQPTFAGGEFSPSLQGRSDVQKFSTALKLARNMVVHPYGGASGRPGTYYVATAQLSTGSGRVVPFSFNQTQNYVLEFCSYLSNVFFRVYLNGALLLCSNNAGTWSSSTYYQLGDIVTYSAALYQCVSVNNLNHTPGSSGTWSLVTTSTPYVIDLSTAGILISNLFGIKFSQSADTLFAATPENFPFTIQRLANNQWHVSLLNQMQNGTSGYFVDQHNTLLGPFMLQNTNVAQTITVTQPGSPPSVTLTSSVPLFLSGQILFKISQVIGGTTEASTVTATTFTGSTFICGSTWRLQITAISGTVAFYLEFQDDTGNWIVLQQFEGTVNTFGSFSKQTKMRVVISGSAGLSVSYSFGCDSYISALVVLIRSITSPTVAVGDIVAGSLLLGIASADWSEGSWSGTRGYPSCVEFFQDRLLFASSTGEPTTTWASQISNYVNFSVSNPILDTDSISVPNPSRKINQILSLLALADVVQFTAGGESTLGIAPGSAALTPSTVSVKTQGYRGATQLAPVAIGNRAVFVQAAGTTLRDLAFDFQSNGYVGDDLTIFARHLFLGYSIIDMAYQQDPDSILWAIRSDGALLSCTYMKEQQVLGWTHHDTLGKFESVACIPNSSGYNELWFSVIRNGVRCIERMASPIQPTGIQDQYFVDSGMTVESSVNTITSVGNTTPATISTYPIPLALGTGQYVVFGSMTWAPLTGTKPTFMTGLILPVTVIDLYTFSVPIDASLYIGNFLSGSFQTLSLTTVSGLDHLNGLTVSVLGDGSVQAQQVVSGGSITLQHAAAVVQVGLPFLVQFQTLSVGTSLSDGTSQDRKVKINQITMNFLNWRGGYIGPDADHLDPIGTPPDLLTTIGQPIPMYSGLYRVSGAGDYSLQSTIFFQQSDPLPVTIIGVIPAFNVGGQ